MAPVAVVHGVGSSVNVQVLLYLQITPTQQRAQIMPHRTSFEVELADAVIRIFDLAGMCSLDLAGFRDLLWWRYLPRSATMIFRDHNYARPSYMAMGDKVLHQVGRGTERHVR